MLNTDAIGLALLALAVAMGLLAPRDEVDRYKDKVLADKWYM